jgi:hypothetical protein
VLAEPDLHVGADGEDGNSGREDLVQGILYEAAGRALPVYYSLMVVC